MSDKHPPSGNGKDEKKAKDGKDETDPDHEEDSPSGEDSDDESPVRNDDGTLVHATDKEKNATFVKGGVGKHSVLKVSPQLLNNEAKKELYQALRAAGIVDRPARCCAGKAEREEDDARLRLLSSRLHRQGNSWGRAAARAISECVKAGGDTPSDVLERARAKLSLGRPKYWRGHGPMIDERKFWNLYEHHLFNTFPGGKTRWEQLVEKAMWDSYKWAHSHYRGGKKKEKIARNKLQETKKREREMDEANIVVINDTDDEEEDEKPAATEGVTSSSSTGAAAPGTSAGATGSSTGTKKAPPAPATPPLSGTNWDNNAYTKKFGSLRDAQKFDPFTHRPIGSPWQSPPAHQPEQSSEDAHTRMLRNMAFRRYGLSLEQYLDIQL